MPILQFNNHASVLIETTDHVLLVDPWLEGTAFNDGWSLLDASTSNAALVDQLKRQAKPLSIWYSHEHSDHFSLSFLKALQQAGLPNVHIVYQQTLDRRVARHLRAVGWKVVELRPGQTLALGQAMSIKVWPFFDSGDSYSLVSADGVNLLNLNDCAVDSVQKCEHILASVKPETTRIDVLLTQFGYANWIGNEGDVQLRQDAAAEKLQRLSLQCQHLNPSVLVPFASFVRFGHEENVYLNDAQNSLEAVFRSPLLASFHDRLCAMKPGDRVALSAFKAAPDFQARNQEARAHWQAMGQHDQPLLRQKSTVPLAELQAAADGFRRSISRNLAWLNRWLEMAGVIKPVDIWLTDTGQRLRKSYRRGLETVSSNAAAHLSCSSEVLLFILKNDFGFNTTIVNGRFRTCDMAAYRRVWRFFILQDLKKMGFGISTPGTTLLLILRNLRKFIVRRVA